MIRCLCSGVTPSRVIFTLTKDMGRPWSVAWKTLAVVTVPIGAKPVTRSWYAAVRASA